MEIGLNLSWVSMNLNKNIQVMQKQPSLEPENQYIKTLPKWPIYGDALHKLITLKKSKCQCQRTDRLRGYMNSW